MSNGEIILYTTEDGKASIQLRAEDGTVWLSRIEIASLFQTTPQNITLHIQGIYDESEADSTSTSKDYLLVQTEKKYSTRSKALQSHYDSCDRVSSSIAKRGSISQVVDRSSSRVSCEGFCHG